MKCECEHLVVEPASADRFLPEELPGRLHKPGRCAGTYALQLFVRDGQRVWLCSCCCLATDVPVLALLPWMLQLISERNGGSR